MVLLKVPQNVPHAKGCVTRQALDHINKKVLLQNVRLCRVSRGERLPAGLGRIRSINSSSHTRTYNANSYLAPGGVDNVSLHHGLHLTAVDGAGAEDGVRALVVGVEAVLGHPVLRAVAAEEHLDSGGQTRDSIRHSYSRGPDVMIEQPNKYFNRHSGLGDSNADTLTVNMRDRGHVQMTSAWGEGSQFLTKGREVAWICY